MNAASHLTHMGRRRTLETIEFGRGDRVVRPIS